MSLQPIELISFNLCPFVQRSVITLEKKGIDFNITYIDLANKPEWFLKLSPLGKVPVVKYGDQVLFESAVINEFLDEITAESLMPSDPLRKAIDRGWIEYSSQVLMDQYLLSVAETAEDFQKRNDSFTEKLQRLEQTVDNEGVFNGTTFSLVDSSLAPLFTRLEIIARRLGRDFLSQFPKLTKMSKHITSQEFVKRSVIDNFEDIYLDFLAGKNSYISA